MIQSLKKFKILLYEKMNPVGTKLLAEQCELVYAKNFEEATILNQVSDVDGIIIRANGSISKTIIESAKNLKVIGRYGAGLDNIDIKAAKKNNANVVYTSGANSKSVAKHFVGLVLNLTRHKKETRSIASLQSITFCDISYPRITFTIASPISEVPTVLDGSIAISPV